MSAPIFYNQTATIGSGASSVAVTLSTSFADTDYAVGVEVPYQTSWWITSKTNTGFTLNLGTSNGTTVQYAQLLILYDKN